MAREVFLNCDMGEGYGKWNLGPDEEIMPLIKSANVACGFHASDPSTMGRTVALAKKYGVAVGAHPSYPDKEGFGRRHMVMTHEELRLAVLYQIGALVGILTAEGLKLNHVKAHGSLYNDMAKMDDYCDAVVSAIAVFKVPMYGLKGTLHEKYCKKYGVPLIAEVFPDVNYAEDGSLKSLTIYGGRPSDQVPEALTQMIKEDIVTSQEGTRIPLGLKNESFTVCIHSDLPNAVEKCTAAKNIIETVA